MVHGADPQPAVPGEPEQGVGGAVELLGAQPSVVNQMRLGHGRVQPRHHDLQIGYGKIRPFFADLETDVRVRAVETAQQPVEERPFRPVRRDRLLVGDLLLEKIGFAEFLVDVMAARDDCEPIVVEAQGVGQPGQHVIRLLELAFRARPGEVAGDDDEIRKQLPGVGVGAGVGGEPAQVVGQPGDQLRGRPAVRGLCG